MDIERLDTLLDSSITYSDVPKEVFLSKLNIVFDSFQEEGDTILISQPGSCCNLYCNPESVRTAYRFVGNKSRLYLDLRFITEITEDLKDHKILDIYSCYSFNCLHPLDWYANDIPFCFYDDEKVGFYKSPDLLIHMDRQKEAMNELKTISGEMTESELRFWLLRFQSTYDFFETFRQNGYFSWTTFSMKYGSILDMISFVELLTQPSFLEEIFQEIDTSEENLTKKILRIEKLLINNDREYFIWLWKNESRYYFENYNYLLVDGIFESFAKLWTWFKPRQLQLLQKYFALTPYETEEFCSNEENFTSTDSIYTLSFHLEIRKKARLSGDFIPMDLWSDDQPMPFWSDRLS
ncbi:MAG: hypothetical protein HWE07_14660 [Cytophagia bacterium]|nr:hypothetical protein [Cytophagia bacterium]